MKLILFIILCLVVFFTTRHAIKELNNEENHEKL